MRVVPPIVSDEYIWKVFLSVFPQKLVSHTARPTFVPGVEDVPIAA